MQEAGLIFEFFEGEDGALIDKQLLLKTQNEATDYKEKYGRPILPGEIGAALSHLNLYKKIVLENIELSLILEDDIDFDSNLVNLVKNINKLKKDLKPYDLILLGYTTSELNYRKKAICSIWGRTGNKEICKFGRPVIWYWAAIGYLIKPEAAAKLLALGELPKMQADYITANSPAYGINLGVTLKPIVWPGELNNHSIIGDRSFKHSEKNKMKVDRLNSSFLKQVKQIPILKTGYCSGKNILNKILRNIKILALKVSLEKYRYVKEENI